VILTGPLHNPFYVAANMVGGRQSYYHAAGAEAIVKDEI
jgi:hypothetical protein